MLKSEITPFANIHRENLQKVEDLLKQMMDPTAPVPPVEDAKAAVQLLQSAQRAFDRFEHCAHDEWGMKERALEKVRHCRLNHRQQDS